MESDIDFIERRNMKNLLRGFVVLSLCVVISSCELLCQAGTGTCGMSDEQMDKFLHPKTYGEYFVKPGMTKEGWRADWVACGGDPSGQHGVYTPPGSTTQVVLAAQNREADRLAICMQSKGYEYRSEP
ncbi:MAG TPA: hypothetical protein VFA14_03240 [Herbaspirillum sp.]|nr:hypothetical protein [Herbaspirillum sp.]